MMVDLHDGQIYLFVNSKLIFQNTIHGNEMKRDRVKREEKTEMRRVICFRRCNLEDLDDSTSNTIKNKLRSSIMSMQ